MTRFARHLVLRFNKQRKSVGFREQKFGNEKRKKLQIPKVNSKFPPNISLATTRGNLTVTALAPKTKSTQNGRHVSNLFNSMFQTFNLVLPLLRFLVALRPKVS